MGAYRKQIQIVGDILYAAEELTIDQNGASITRLIQKANISHKKMPSYKKHVSFVKSKPYSKWYVVVNNKKKIGSIYLTNLNEIAISMKKDFDKNQIKENIIKLLMTKNPRKRYLFNVSPKNTNTINFFKKNSFKLVQYTFELEL